MLEPPTVQRLALTREEAAHAMGISRRKLDQLIADDTSGLPFVRIGSKPVFPIHELKTWLTANVGKTI